MNIQIHLAALRQLGWREFALRFLLGGVITASAGVVAMKFGPIVGGLLLAFPAILPASLTLVEKHENERTSAYGTRRGRRGRQAAAADAAGAVLGSVGMVVFGFLVWQGAPHYDPWIVLGSATCAWFVVAVGLWGICKHWHGFIQRLSS
ncbi:MAG: DUF3147 family protein [Nitrospiraceae bacterium]